MTLPTIDFNSIREHNWAKNKGFEELVVQLIPSINDVEGREVVRHGTPDGGLEAHVEFEDFAYGASIIGLTNALNYECIPTMHGKAWTAATIFHMLRNSGYAGRTVYRRLKAGKIRDEVTGKKKRRLSVRPEAEWIDVPDATPAIVPEALFDAVQRRLDDPERLRQGRRISTYGLAGRIRCRHCGSAMVGQTMRGRYRYYRCRRAFAGPKHDRCDSRYVRADSLETRLLQEVAALLSQPTLILGELKRLGEGSGEKGPTEDVRTRLEELEQQRTRLLRLYQLGEVDDEYLERESSGLKAERGRLLSLLHREPVAGTEMPTEADLAELCDRVRMWVESHGQQELPLVGRGLQLSVSASKDQSEVTGVIPEYAPDCNHADVCSMVINSPTASGTPRHPTAGLRRPSPAPGWPSR